jgi:hypothetical protein
MNNMSPVVGPIFNIHPQFAQALLSRGVPLQQINRRRSEPRRWELREVGLLPPHTHAREIARRQGQLKRIAAKQRIIDETHRRRLGFVTPSSIRRKLRTEAHVYL